MLKPAMLWLLILSMITANCSKNPTDPQGTLVGVVTMEGQEEHSGIVIQLKELGQHVTTSSTGNYSFSSVPAGTYTLSATDGNTTRHLFDFIIIEDVSVTAGRQTVAPTRELPLFHRVENDLTGQVRWTSEDGPYLITRSVTVQPGAQLILDPGTIVKFEGYFRLNVLGRLTARGTATDSIWITGMEIANTSGDWDRIRLEGSGKDSADTLAYCRIEYANIGAACSRVSPVIYHNTISHCSSFGLVFSSSDPEVRQNLLTDNYGGISCDGGSAGIIQANTIQANTTAGIACAESHPEIRDNFISYNQRGLLAKSESDPLVWHNLFLDNEDAIYLFYYCDPRIEANQISGQQQYGLHLVGYNNPDIHLNNIIQNGSSHIHLKDQPQDVQAQQNWWDSNDPGEISALVWDGQDDSRLGYVLLDPILTAPVDSAGPTALP